MQHLEELKRKAVAKAASEAAANANSSGVLDGIKLPKRKRVLDSLKEQEASDGEGDDSDDEGVDEGGLLDWRAKTM